MYEHTGEQSAIVFSRATKIYKPQKPKRLGSEDHLMFQLDNISELVIQNADFDC